MLPNILLFPSKNVKTIFKKNNLRNRCACSRSVIIFFFFFYFSIKSVSLRKVSLRTGKNARGPEIRVSVRGTGAVMSVLSQASPRPDVQVALLTRRGETCKLPLIELSNGCAF